MVERPPNRPTRALAQLQRDLVLQRLAHARRWLLAGAAALSAGFAALVAVVAPGKSYGAGRHSGSVTSGTSSRPSTAGSTGPQMPPLASPSQLGLQGPVSAPGPTPSASQPAAPAPTSAQAPPVSGGS